jgi:hypothetical protein
MSEHIRQDTPDTAENAAMPPVPSELTSAAPAIAPPPAATVEPPKPAPAAVLGAPESSARQTTAIPPADEPAAPPSSRFAMLAASVGIAAALGAAIGSLATAGLMPAPSKPEIKTVDDTRGLKESLAKLGADMAAMKASADAAHRSSNAQFAKLAERVEKAQAEPAARLAKIADSIERAQNEPAAKLAKAADAIDRAQSDAAGKLSKMSEALDRLERRQIVQRESPETTGSIARPAPAEEPKPKTAALEGWSVQEVYRGRAVVESRQHGVFEVAPGSTLPGLGRVEDVVRQNGRWIVLTQKGVIASGR